MSGQDELPTAPRWYGSDRPDDRDHEPGRPDPATEHAAPQPERVAWQPDRPASAAPQTSPSGQGIGHSARVVGAALVGRDLLRPGPGLWPFGEKARARRARRDEVAAETQRRRAALRRELADNHGAGPPSVLTNWRPVDRRRNRAVIAGLIVVVAGMFTVVFWQNHHSAHPATTADRPSAPRSSTASTSAVPIAPHSGRAFTAQAPIPSGGAAVLSPPTHHAGDPATVVVAAAPVGPPTALELAAPEAAAAAWLARWCPFSSTDPFGAAENRARAAMTATGWSRFDPDANAPARASWAKTVAAKETGRCSAPSAQVSPEAPRSDTSAIVIVVADRIVTADGAAPYTERIADTRIVRRDTDGLWRVDLSTTGG